MFVFDSLFSCPIIRNVTFCLSLYVFFLFRCSHLSFVTQSCNEYSYFRYDPQYIIIIDDDDDDDDMQFYLTDNRWQASTVCS